MELFSPTAPSLWISWQWHVKNVPFLFCQLWANKSEDWFLTESRYGPELVASFLINFIILSNFIHQCWTGQKSEFWAKFVWLKISEILPNFTVPSSRVVKNLYRPYWAKFSMWLKNNDFAKFHCSAILILALKWSKMWLDFELNLFVKQLKISRSCQIPLFLVPEWSKSLYWA